MTKITKPINLVRQRLEQAAIDCGRLPEDIRILAVSKTRSVEEIQQAAAAGLTRFGENYLQEAIPKIAALWRDGFEWHFIGPVQSNKTRDLAAHFDWVQSVDRLKVAQRLSAQRSIWAAELNICVQVNIDNEPQKAGAAPSEVAQLCKAIAELPRLKLRGIMVIPSANSDRDQQFASFSRARALYESLREDGMNLDTLSMGMSADLEAAIRAGSTMVRIGTDIFGSRV